MKAYIFCHKFLRKLYVESTEKPQSIKSVT